MSLVRPLARAFSLLVISMWTATAFAQIVYDFTVPVDADNDPGSGCTLTTPDGPFDGAEFSIITEVTAMGVNAQVTGVSVSICGGGSFGPPQLVNPGGWPVGMGNGDGGADVVETVVGIPDTITRGPIARLAVLTEGVGLDDALLTNDGTTGGGSIILGLPPFVIPTLTIGGIVFLVVVIGAAAIYLRRRHGLLVSVAAAGIAVAFSGMGVLRALAPDGLIDDWLAAQRLATDPATDGSPDITAFWGQPVGAETLFLRIDATLNAPPNAVDDPAAITEDAVPNTTMGNVLTNDDDGGDGPGPLVVTTTGTSVGSFGSLDLMADGSFTYTLDNANPQVNALNVGDTLIDTIAYTISDGATTDTANVVVTISGANDPPIATDDADAITEDAVPDTTSGNVLSNDDDGGDGPDPLSVTNAGTIPGMYGSLDLMANGDYTYTLDNSNPAVNALNDGDSLIETIAYTVTDGIDSDMGDLVITINGVNDPPTAVDDAASITEDAVPNTVAGDVLSNDDDGGDGPGPLTVTTAGMSAGSFGSIDIQANGTFTYTLDNANPQVDALNVGDSLMDSFAYTVSDGSDTDSATLVITIDGANDAPVAVDDAGSVQEDVTLSDTGNVLSNDTDVDNLPGDLTVTTTGMQAGTYGSVMLGANGGFNYTLANGNAIVQALAQGETQPDAFPYTMTDGTDTDSATLTIDVAGTNDAPVAVADPAEVAMEDVPAMLNILGNDMDVDNGATLSVMSIDTTGTQGMVVNNGANVTYNAPQSLSMGAMIMDTFSYVASDEFAAASSPATVTVTATGQNDPPVASDDSEGTDEDTAIVIDVLSNDSDIDTGDTLMVASVDTTGTMGLVTNNGTNVGYDPGGIFDYLVAGQIIMDTFDYSATDGITADVATVTVTVTGVNDAPVLTLPSPFITFVEGDAPRIIDPIAGVTDVDSMDFDTGQLRVELTTNGTANDRLAINNEAPGTGIETSGANVLYLSNVIGTFAGGTDGFTPLVVDLSGPNATPVAVRELVRNMTFENVASPPNTMDRTVEFEVTDGDGASSGAVTETIEVALPSTCDGVVVNNECWWLGTNGETCDQVCSIHGGYNTATETFAGSGGNAAQCEQVMLALNAQFGNPPNPTPANPMTGEAIGCASDFGGSATTVWYSSPATTAAAGLMNHRRACACNDQPPPQSLSYAGPYNLPRAIMIASISPTFTGYVDSWSISPPLPAGLNFDTNTGVITGTPTTITAAMTYTVTASNAGGDLMANFDLAVIAAPPSGLNYPNAPFSFPVNNAIATQLPSVVGQVDSYSIAPALPTGLMLNTGTGAITGTPTVASPATNYTVTATNVDGNDMTTFSLEVTAVVLNCNGVVVGGFCWWGGLNGDSCTDVCNGKGGYNAATESYAGSGGNNAQCGAVMTALEAMFGSPANPTPVTTDSGLAVGCASDYSGSANTRRHTSPATTEGATATNHRRACACNSQPAPMGLTYAGSPFAFPQGVDIGTVSPTVTNFVQTWSISPALPPGLSFNTTTGQITGTPTTLQGAANYNVTASNAGGSDMTTISIAVTGQPPMNLNYPFDPYIFNVGVAISAQVPTVTGTVNSYSIAPALPSGLSFNTSTGAITGTPTATSAATNYTVTATNGAGNDMEVISIQVNAAITCSGTVAGGWCWYFGTNGQSCDTVCGTHGGTTNGTISFAGSGGTTDHCAHVAFELNADTGGPFNPLPATTNGTNVGCHSDYEDTANTIRGTAATSQSATGTFLRRMCSCSN